MTIPVGLIDAIFADAVRRTGCSRNELRLVQAQLVTWRDDSLGCPEHGMGYAQVLTPGYWIVIEADAQRLDYRATQRGHFRLCTAPDAVAPVADAAE